MRGIEKPSWAFFACPEPACSELVESVEGFGICENAFRAREFNGNATEGQKMYLEQ